MKLIAIMILPAMLTGCFFQTVNQYDINDAIKVCGGIEEVAEITAYGTGVEGFTCFDGNNGILHKYKPE